MKLKVGIRASVVVFVVTALITLASACVTLQFGGFGFAGGVGAGCLYVEYDIENALGSRPVQWWIDTTKPRIAPGPLRWPVRAVRFSAGPFLVFDITLWHVTAFAGMMTASCWWVIRRRERTHQVCRNCHYDLQGLRSRACPECGTSFESTGASLVPTAI